MGWDNGESVTISWESYTLVRSVTLSLGDLNFHILWKNCVCVYVGGGGGGVALTPEAPDMAYD